MCKKWTEEVMKNSLAAVSDIGSGKETILCIREMQSNLMFQMRPSEKELLH